MRLLLTFILFLFFIQTGFAQKKAQATDSAIAKKTVIRDSAYIADSTKRAHIRRVTRRSAIVPGWGQINNGQAYKVPIIYGGLGLITYLFVDNLQNYRELRDAFILRTDTFPANDNLIPERLRPLSPNSLKFYRDQYRRNVDYSALAFIIFWGLNVVDATVFAHLKDFDVSDEISIRVKTPQYNFATKQGQFGIAINLNPSLKNLKPLPAR